MKNTNTLRVNASYGFKYSYNTSLSIIQVKTDDYDEYEVRSEYNELMFHHYSFVEVVKFLDDLFKGKYAV